VLLPLHNDRAAGSARDGGVGSRKACIWTGELTESNTLTSDAPTQAILEFERQTACTNYHRASLQEYPISFYHPCFFRKKKKNSSPIVSHHYRTPWVCRVPETLGKLPKTLGKLFAECNTRRTALAINSTGKANFAECHLSDTRQTFCHVQFSSRRKETVVTPDPPLTATSPSVKRQGTRQIFVLYIF